MICLKEAIRIIFESFRSPRTEEVDIYAALGSVLAQDIFARFDSPEFDRSIMDGFAVRSIDAENFPTKLKCVAFVPAGCLPSVKVKKGECIKIATGAKIPAGADSVIMKEDTNLSTDGLVEVTKKIKKGQNIALRSRDFRKKQLLLNRGAVLNAASIGLLASQGFGKVSIFALPRIALISTGDEIVEPGKKKRHGQIWDASGSFLMAALLKRDIPFSYLGIVPDEPVRLYEKIRQGLDSDFLIITGAVSEGDKDLVPAVLRKAGVTVKFHKVAIRPGKPFIFGVKRSSFVFGLPGNPVSSLVSFLLFVLPAIEKMSGKKPGPVFQKGFLTKSVYNKTDRLSLFPGRIARGSDYVGVEPISYSGSSDLLAVSKAGCFFMIGKGQRIEKGAEVEFIELTL